MYVLPTVSDTPLLLHHQEFTYTPLIIETKPTTVAIQPAQRNVASVSDTLLCLIKGHILVRIVTPIKKRITPSRTR